MVNTKAKGTRFEYAVAKILRRSGFVVSRNAASKPWDLNAANRNIVLAVECKSSQISPAAAGNIYTELIKKLMIREDGKEPVPSAFIPVVFYIDKLKRVSMYTKAMFVGSNGIGRRPYFDGTKVMEIENNGNNTRRSSEESN